MREPVEPSGGADPDERDVRATPVRSVAEEWALVLAAEGMAPTIRRDAEVFVVSVQASDAPAAAGSLESYERENPRGARKRTAPMDRIRDVDRFVAATAAVALLGFFALTGPANQATSWFARGSGDSARILAGEFWLTVTSLSLHADVGHVVANALFGSLFLAAVCAGFGPGVGVALTLLAGAAGNLMNAVFQGPDHLSIGASTAVFGAVGLLAGRGLALRLRVGGRGLRVWVPIAAGLALIAMLGTSAKSDVWAHLFGFLAGGPIGVLASLALPRAPGIATQAAVLLAGCGSVWLCWQRALA